MRRAEKSSNDIGQKQRAMRIFGMWTQQNLSPSILSVEGFPAKTLATLGRDVAWEVLRRVSGTSSTGLFAILDHDTWQRKTCQRSFDEECQPYSGKWPRSGMMRGGTVYELPMLARRIAEKDGLRCSGSLWPTPTVSGNCNDLNSSAKSGVGLSTAVGGRLNPRWTLALMGFPLDWFGSGLPKKAKRHIRGNRRAKRR